MAVASAAGVLIYSLLGTDIWLPRNLAASLPAEVVLVGAALASLAVPPR